MEAINASQLANPIIGQMNEALSKQFDADVIFIKSGMHAPLDSLFRIEVELIKAEAGKGRGKGKDRLCILLETGGGYIETVGKRLVDVMRRHYKHVSFVIPDYAYSAGTVLALSGDDIVMDYYSILGPIDPQNPDETGGNLLPGAGYLAKFKELAKENQRRQNDQLEGEAGRIILPH